MVAVSKWKMRFENGLKDIRDGREGFREEMEKSNDIAEKIRKEKEMVKEEMEKKIKEIQRRNQEKREREMSRLESLSSEMSSEKSELSRLRKLHQETQSQLEQLRESVAGIDREVSDLSQVALDVVQEEKRFPTLQARKNFFFICTRITWEKISRDENKIKGFVINPIKNDIVAFKLDRKEMGGRLSNNFIWDYIGAGIGEEWNMAQRK